MTHDSRPSPAAAPDITPAVEKGEEHDVELQKPVALTTDLAEEGAKRIELMQQVWGRHGKLWIFTCMSLCFCAYQFDYTTFINYYTFALSEYAAISQASAIAVAADLIFSLLKPVWAKSSDIFGRGIIYPVALMFIEIGLIAAASSATFAGLAAGTILRVSGLTALNSLNTIVISDLTTTRQRGFGVNFQFFPLIVLPWVSSFIAQEVLDVNHGIGWRWGVGILAIVFPFGIIGVTTILLVFQKRAEKLEEQITQQLHYTQRPKLNLLEFCSSIDLGGVSIIITSFAFILLPLSLASLQPQGYATPWVVALIVLGGLMLLIGLPLYEERFAKHPFFPLRYIKHRAIGLAFLLYFTDYMAASASHGYLYNWAYVAKGFTIMQASNIATLNQVITFVTGMLFGLIMWYAMRTKQYKWWIVGGCIIRFIGYGVMFRIRTANPTMAELYIVQVVQGVGDGIVQTGGYVAASINVPHKETAQMTALIVMIGMLGSSVGNSIGGAIYTGTFREQLALQLGDSGTPELIDGLFNSISLVLPEWGTPDRIAINLAYDHVTSFFFIAAMVIIVPGFIAVFFLPNQTLNDSQNLIESHGMFGDNEDIDSTLANVVSNSGDAGKKA